MSGEAFVIGIDPGVHTGVALWCPKQKALSVVTSMRIVDAMQLVASHHAAKTLAYVVMEDARLRKWFGTKGHEAKQGAGSIKRDCQIWVEWFVLIGCAYKSISPQSKGAKVDAAVFQRLTGWTARTNNHGRDAAMLVLGSKNG